MAIKFNSVLICFATFLVLIAVILHVITPNPSSQETTPSFQKYALFAERVNACRTDTSTSTPILYDLPAQKNKFILCKTGLSKYCVRRSPVEEQEHFFVVCPLYSLNQDANKLLYSLHTSFKHYCETLGVKFTQVEYAFPTQNFVLTKPDNEPYDIQLPGHNIFYLRENLVNVAEKKLPEDYEYISWIDAHVIFDNPYIFQEMIVLLGKNNVVAPHSLIRFKDKQNRTSYHVEYPFVYQAFYSNITPKYDPKYNVYPYYGLAFATRKDIFKAMNGVPDTCISGGCDVFMSFGLTNGTIDESRLANYDDSLTSWILNAVDKIQGKFAYVNSPLTHLDHYFALRKYSHWSEAWHKLDYRNFDPYNDLAKDINGTFYFKQNFELAYDFWKFYAAI